MARRPVSRLVEFALAEAPARTVSLCSGCAHLQGTNADGTARCDAFGTIPAAVWSGQVDHRTPIDGDGGATFSPLGAYGLTIERGYDAQRQALAALAVGDLPEDDEGPETPDDEVDPDDQDGDGEPEDDFPTRPDTPAKDTEEDPDAPAEEFHSLLVVEGAPTGDRRFIEDSALTWRDLPLALMWQTETPEMGGHAHSVHVGQITRIERQGTEIHGWGFFLDGAPGSDGERFASHLREAGRLGISVDMDDADVEVDFPEEDPDDEEFFFPEPELVRFTHARLMGATVVTFPAFAEAYIEPIDDPEADEAAALVAAAIPMAPPAAWFDDPGLTEPTPLTIDDDGRVYGHLAVWGTCHTSFQGTCVTPPHEDAMGYFTTGAVRTAEGVDVPVGQLTFGTGHADTGLSHADALRHYDHTGSAAADLAAGPDSVGIWLAGALRPGTSPGEIRALRAAAVSGDWRRIGGALRLVAALAVNVPGFPIPRTAARTSAAHQQTLVAAGIVPRRPRASLDLDPIAEILAARVGRDRSTRAGELAARVHLTEFACGCGKRPKPGIVGKDGRALTASGSTPEYEIVAPDGTRKTVSSLIVAMRESKAVRGTYRVVYPR